MININCTIKFAHNDETYEYWPILNAEPLAYIWPPNILATNYSTIFTSQIATKIFSSWNTLINSEYIAAVGSMTAAAISAKTAHKNIIFPIKEGLSALLNEVNFTNNSTVYIFTALNGNTVKTLNSRDKIDFKYQIIPIYKLIPINDDTFLQKLFDYYHGRKELKFIFHCRSVMILTEVLRQLKIFFSCTCANNLPEFIYFSIASKKNALQNAIDSLEIRDRIF